MAVAFARTSDGMDGFPVGSRLAESSVFPADSIHYNTTVELGWLLEVQKNGSQPRRSLGNWS